MANGFVYSYLILSLSFSLLIVLFVSPSYVHGDPDGFGWMPKKPACHGSLAECLEGDEFEIDSENNRRILATSQYISYQVLKKNTVPCSHRGASYYNCAPGAQANPYSRSCTAITRCRG